jgi:hypothetical protein
MGQKQLYRATAVSDTTKDPSSGGYVDPMKRDTTSLKIRPDLWKLAKIESIKRDISLSELIEELLENYLSGQQHTSQNRR